MSDQIVKNGCNGKCCEKFTLPFSFEELERMILANTNSELAYVRDNGDRGSVYNRPDILQIRDMLIPLGKTEIDPQISHSLVSERIAYQLSVPEGEPILLKDYNKLSSNWKEWLRLIDGKIYYNVFTCKNFDTEKRICNIYDTRPKMCKSFGHGCKYEGCSFDTDRIKEEQRKQVSSELCGND